MLKSCSRCGKIHDFNKQCYVNRQVRGASTADKFRKTYKWHQKSLDIRERDKNLCRVCLANIFDTQTIYNFDKLEVHHIIPLEEEITKGLDDDNLITLCCYHHKLADKGIIPRNILTKLIDENCDLEAIKKEVTNRKYPPTF